MPPATGVTGNLREMRRNAQRRDNPLKVLPAVSTAVHDANKNPATISARAATCRLIARCGAFLWLDRELVNPPSTVPAAPLRGSVQGTERNT
jgi:hypothetical protein